jgi:hypothetical protein
MYRPWSSAIAATFFVLIALVAHAPSAQATGPPAHAADLDCSDFGSQASAQDYFLSRGGPSSDPDRLDSDGDGIACESNPCPCNHSTTPTTPSQPTPPPPDTDNDGVPDGSDACPNEPAYTSSGCPPPPAPPSRLSFYAVVTGVTDARGVSPERFRGRRRPAVLESRAPAQTVRCVPDGAKRKRC